MEERVLTKYDVTTDLWNTCKGRCESRRWKRDAAAKSISFWASVHAPTAVVSRCDAQERKYVEHLRQQKKNNDERRTNVSAELLSRHMHLV